MIIIKMAQLRSRGESLAALTADLEDPLEECELFLLRLSVHDPIMPLNLESMKEGGTRSIAKKLYGFLKECGSLDIAAIEKFIA